MELIWCHRLHLVAWTVMSLFSVFAQEVTVRNSELKLCEEDKRVCVTDPRDCGPPPPASIHKTLNMSCCYQMSHSSVSCEWSLEPNSRTESHVSLIFSSEDKIYSCEALFNPLAVLNVTARIRNYMMGTEIWSRPHTVAFYHAVKPSQPLLTVLGSTEDSVVVSWRSSSDGDCRLRYRDDSTHTWTQALDSVLAHLDQTLTYTIRDLLPFTAYRAAVACREESGRWSDWSSDVSTRTLDRVPSRPPDVCYRVEKTDTGGSFLLHLMWKQDPDLHDAGGRILGYQVSYEPAKNRRLQNRFVENVTEVTALLVVDEGNCSVTVRAFNTAGYGPAAHVSVDTQRQDILPSVRNLWVSSSVPGTRGLLVQWENPSVPPVSHLTVQWRSESTSRWTTVDNFNNSTVIDVDPGQSYLISVFPVYNQQCGSPQSLPADLKQGALMEAVRLKVVRVTKTTVTVMWAWQQTSGPIRVNGYRVTLRRDSERQTQSVWPDQRQHTFLNLTPNTEYSLQLLADDVSRDTIPVRTDFDERPVWATATPLLLLAVTVLIICILSRTVYKSYFFPLISSPRGSTAGQWLMDPNHQKPAERHILDMEDFKVTDVLGEKSVITVGPLSQPSTEEDLHEDCSLRFISHLIIKLSALELDPQYIPEAPVITQHPLVSLQSYHTDYLVNCHQPDRVFTAEESREVDVLPHQQHEANSYFPQTEEESRRVDFSQTPQQKEAAVKCAFDEFMTNSHCVYQMSCEADYVVNSSFLGKSEV